MTKQARLVADGDFNSSVRVYSDDEIGQLGMAFNHMTLRLQEAILQQEEEREKLAGILSNMTDGVIAANRNGQIILFNRAAEEMLQVRMADVLRKKDAGRSAQPASRGRDVFVRAGGAAVY